MARQAGGGGTMRGEGCCSTCGGACSTGRVKAHGLLPGRCWVLVHDSAGPVMCAVCESRCLGPTWLAPQRIYPCPGIHCCCQPTADPTPLLPAPGHPAGDDTGHPGHQQPADHHLHAAAGCHPKHRHSQQHRPALLHSLSSGRSSTPQQQHRWQLGQHAQQHGCSKRHTASGSRRQQHQQ